MSFSKGIFSGIGDAKKIVRLPKLPVGKHVAKIFEQKFFESKKRKPTVVVEMEVVSSTNPAVEAGDKHGWMQQMGEFPSYFLADVKNVISAALEEDPDDVDEAAALIAFEKNLLVGKTVQVEVTPNPEKPDWPFIVFSSVKK